MAILYDWYENPGESDDSEEKGLHPRIFLNGKVGTDKLCRMVSVSAILSCRPFFILIFLRCIKMKHYGFSRKSIWKNLETFP